MFSYQEAPEPCPLGFVWRLHGIDMIESRTTVLKCDWTNRSGLMLMGGEIQQGISVQILPALLVQYSFFQSMGHLDHLFWEEEGLRTYYQTKVG